MTPLTPSQITAALRMMPGWTGDEHSLKRRVKFSDFVQAMHFMQACIPVIELVNHHPSWTNTYNTVDIVLNTHDAGGRVTELDVELAQELDKVLKQIAPDVFLMKGD